MLFPRFLAVAGLGSSLACWSPLQGAEAAGAEDSGGGGGFIRFVEGPDRAHLQTALVPYAHEDGTKLDLIGVVHIADAEYYERFNEDFKAYDALLFELVGEPEGELTKEALRGDGRKNALRFYMVLMGKLLDLQFQLEEIDYTAPNFVHADLDLATFLKLQEERKENLLSLLERGIEAQEKGGLVSGSKFDFAALTQLFGEEATPETNKLALGKQFRNIEGLFAGMEGEQGSVIVGARNDAALAVLQREREAGKRRFGLFYGAAHLADFDRKLREEFGFTRGEPLWRTAWDISKEATPAAVEEEAAAGDGEGEAAAEEDEAGASPRKAA